MMYHIQSIFHFGANQLTNPKNMQMLDMNLHFLTKQKHDLDIPDQHEKGGKCNKHKMYGKCTPVCSGFHNTKARCRLAFLLAGVSALLWVVRSLAPGLAVWQPENGRSHWSAHLGLRAQSQCYVSALLRHGSVT